MTFTHACGHTPLPGYTIKRGVSTGGFGEVYFGLTDGGKEVALKRIIRHQDIELRGIRQCLNLKHPHLVHLYDLKTDDRGDHWLIMEFIRGETLHAVLRKNSRGLTHDLIGPWFGQMAAAVHSLHEQGIVHRDLKPANIFLENGLVKVGDYGLCKFIGGSQHRSQTQHVGTIHYMAPEIGKGEYARPIDIYAAGVLLFEMTTGRVPFDGETTGEILFKHLSETPDLTGTGPFAPIIARAMAKAASDRFGSLAEMARRVAEIPKTNGAAVAAPPVTYVGKAAPTETAVTAKPPATPSANASTVVMSPPAPTSDTAGRLALAAATAALVIAAVSLAALDGEWGRLRSALAVSVVGSWGILLMQRMWPEPAEDSLSRRLILAAFGAGLGLLAIWTQGVNLDDSLAARSEPAARSAFFGAIYPNNRSLPVAVGSAAYFGLALAILRWWHLAEPLRAKRVSVPALLAVGFWAYVLLFLLPGSDERLVGFTSLLTIAAAVQIASPRREPDPAPSKRLRLRGV